MRILRTTERHGAGWREQNFIPDDEIYSVRNGVESAVTGRQDRNYDRFTTK